TPEEDDQQRPQAQPSSPWPDSRSSRCRASTVVADEATSLGENNRLVGTQPQHSLDRAKGPVNGYICPRRVAQAKRKPPVVLRPFAHLRQDLTLLHASSRRDFHERAERIPSRGIPLQRDFEPVTHLDGFVVQKLRRRTREARKHDVDAAIAVVIG